jgi:hypothetical protein
MMLRNSRRSPSPAYLSCSSALPRPGLSKMCCLGCSRLRHSWVCSLWNHRESKLSLGTRWISAGIQQIRAFRPSRLDPGLFLDDCCHLNRQDLTSQVTALQSRRRTVKLARANQAHDEATCSAVCWLPNVERFEVMVQLNIRCCRFGQTHHSSTPSFGVSSAVG